ncbi:hypothetical protein P7266_1764 [Lactococcus cremoris]|nr:hypothetical protein P7266_1764 [Lactococcus cremoris]
MVVLSAINLLRNSGVLFVEIFLHLLHFQIMLGLTFSIFIFKFVKLMLELFVLFSNYPITHFDD